ncbi:MAG: hypothetical protein GEU88_09540 [Solirubrobacterales bacterium]|nr:hypothetical protein [Solirubrobacterales bacterium]
MRGRLCAGIAVMAAAVALGCGDDQDESVSKEAFIAEANRICAKSARAIEEAAGEVLGKDGPTPAELRRFAVEVVAPGAEEQVDGIAALAMPEGDEEELERILSRAREGIDALREDPGSLESGPPELDAAAREIGEYGVARCAE